MQRLAWIRVLIFSFLLLSACDLVNSGDTAVDTISTTPDAAETPVVTAVAQSTPNFTAPITTTQESQQLTVWLPPEIAMSTEEGAGILADQLVRHYRRKS